MLQYNIIQRPHISSPVIVCSRSIFRSRITAIIILSWSREFSKAMVVDWWRVNTSRALSVGFFNSCGGIRNRPRGACRRFRRAPPAHYAHSPYGYHHQGVVLERFVSRQLQVSRIVRFSYVLSARTAEERWKFTLLIEQKPPNLLIFLKRKQIRYTNYIGRFLFLSMSKRLREL